MSFETGEAFGSPLTAMALVELCPAYMAAPPAAGIGGLAAVGALAADVYVGDGAAERHETGMGHPHQMEHTIVRTWKNGVCMIVYLITPVFTSRVTFRLDGEKEISKILVDILNVGVSEIDISHNLTPLSPTNK